MNRVAQLPLRRADAADVPALRDLYASAVTSLGPTAYSAEQVDAWRAFAHEPAFADFILDIDTYLAVDGATILGFCGIAADGHVASIYVRPGSHRRGIATALLKAVLAMHPRPGSGRYYAEASAFSLPLFERCGFRLTGSEHSDRNGVRFERFLVERRIVGPI